MSLYDRAAAALAAHDAGRINHALQLEMVDLVRAYHARATEPEPLSISLKPEPIEDTGIE